jgi:putative transposase
MPDYHRVYVNGGTYFFTIVTYMRYPIFKEETAISLLKNCFQRTMKIHPFKVDAIVIMPDHLHTIWTLPTGEFDFSVRWKQIKGTFSKLYSGNSSRNLTQSMISKKEKSIWQRRFWEHAIRSQEDFNKRCDYIHYNPVKHGLVNIPTEWEHSSFRKFVEKGLYDKDWGKFEERELIEMDLE